MSENTTCNFCNHQARLKRVRPGFKITTIPEDGGMTDYEHPSDVDIMKLSDLNRKRYFVAWMMELTESCRC